MAGKSEFVGWTGLTKLPVRISVPESLDCDDEVEDDADNDSDGGDAFVALRLATVSQLERHVAMLDRLTDRAKRRRDTMWTILQEAKGAGRGPDDVAFPSQEANPGVAGT